MKHLIAIALISAAFSAPALAAEGSSCHFHGNQPVADTTVDRLRRSAQSSWSVGQTGCFRQAVKHDKIETVDGKKANRQLSKNPAES